jgi:hypothetical protein
VIGKKAAGEVESMVDGLEDLRDIREITRRLYV